MNVFVHKIRTGKFLAGDDLWVEGDQQARDFIDATAALLYCVQRRLNDVEVLLCYDGEQFDKLIPVANAPQS